MFHKFNDYDEMHLSAIRIKYSLLPLWIDVVLHFIIQILIMQFQEDNMQWIGLYFSF